MGTDRLAEVLEIVERTVAGGRLPLVVFDLDSTLFSTADRNLRILSEFASEFSVDFPELAAHIGQLTGDDMGWSVLEPLARRGYAPEGLQERFMPFWVARFFTDDYVREDAPNPGAVEYVNACHDRGAMIYYLTGRHRGGMEHGTVASLHDNGFPYWRGRAVLHLKPNFEMPDLAYKAEAVADIRSYMAPVVATYENEPGNANLFLRSFPTGLHFFVETEHSPEAEAPSDDLIRVPDFRLA